MLGWLGTLKLHDLRVVHAITQYSESVLSAQRSAPTVTGARDSSYGPTITTREDNETRQASIDAKAPGELLIVIWSFVSTYILISFRFNWLCYNNTTAPKHDIWRRRRDAGSGGELDCNTRSWETTSLSFVVLGCRGLFFKLPEMLIM